MRLIRRLVAGAILLTAANVPAIAQTSETREVDDAVLHAYAQGTAGPATIALSDQATLKLPKSFVFVPPEAGRHLMHGMGNASSASLLGLVIPSNNYAGWFIALRLEPTGHVDGTAVAALDHEEIRSTLAASARRGNEARVQLGSSPLDAGAFLEPPKYDAPHNSFTTAIRVYESGPSNGDEDSAHVHTLIFGRTHTLSLTLIEGIAGYAARRPTFEAIVGGTAFVPGHRAVDFVAGSDPVVPQLLEVLFGGLTTEDIAHRAADDAAEAKRIAALPPPKTYTKEIKLAFFGVLGLLALLMSVLAFSSRDKRTVDVQRSGGIDRVTRQAARR